MGRLLVTHGRSHESDSPVLTRKPLEAAPRFGLERVQPPGFTQTPVSMAFSGGAWRPDALPESAVAADAAGDEEPAELQREIAADMLAAAPAAGSDAESAELFGWDTLNGLATRLDELSHTGDLIVRLFLEDVERCFTDETRRQAAIGRVVDAVNEAGGDVILLGHSLGGRRFPQEAARWVNV